MSSNRLLNIVFFTIISCVGLANCSVTKGESLQRNLPEAKQEFSDAIQKVYLEEDDLLWEEFFEIRSVDRDPDCLRGNGVKVFGSNESYEVTLSRFTEIFESMRWESVRHPERTPADRLNYLSTNEHMLFSIVPSSQFDGLQISYPDNASHYKNVYAIHYGYHNPNAEACFF